MTQVILETPVGTLMSGQQPGTTSQALFVQIPAYQPNLTYPAGCLVLYQSVLYECTTAYVDQGSWPGSPTWTPVAGVGSPTVGTDGTLGGPGGTPLTSRAVVTVNPSGDTTGATDFSAIQTAINTLSTLVYPNQGGIVRLAAGTFFINQMLTVTTDNIVLWGSGQGNPTGSKSASANPLYGGTVLQLTSTFTGAYGLKFGQSGTPTRTLTGCFINHLALDCSNAPANVVGLLWQVFKGGGERFYCYKATSDGIQIDGNGSTSFPNGAWDNQFYNWTVENSTGRNVVLQNGASDNMFFGLVSKYAGNATTLTSDGVYIDATSPSNRFDPNTYIYSCGGKAINAKTAMELKIIGGRFEDTNGGIYIDGGSVNHGGYQIVGATIRNPSASADNTYDAINITSSVALGGGLISDITFTTDQGNTNGTISGTQYNRPARLINIASANVQGCVIGEWVANSTGSGYSGGTTTYGTQAINDVPNSIYTGSVGQSNFPELRSGLTRLLFKTGSPNGATFANVGSVQMRTDGGHGTSAYVKESGAGTNTGWVPMGSRMLRKSVVTATPSATANTLGTTQTVSPSTDYFSFVAHAIRLVSGGTFASETLTVNVNFNFSDSTTQPFQATFTASGTTTDLTLANLMLNAFKDGVFLTSVGVNCQSSIASSAANVTATIAAVNG